MRRVGFLFFRNHCNDPYRNTRRDQFSTNILMIHTAVHVETIPPQQCNETYRNPRQARFQTSTLRRVVTKLIMQTMWPVIQNDVIIKLQPCSEHDSLEYLLPLCTYPCELMQSRGAPLKETYSTTKTAACRILTRFSRRRPVAIFTHMILTTSV